MVKIEASPARDLLVANTSCSRPRPLVLMIFMFLWGRDLLPFILFLSPYHPLTPPLSSFAPFCSILGAPIYSLICLGHADMWYDCTFLCYCSRSVLLFFCEISISSTFICHFCFPLSPSWVCLGCCCGSLPKAREPCSKNGAYLCLH